MPAAWKNSAISSASGAPPDTQKRSRPPRAARSFAKTSRSATAFWTRRRRRKRPAFPLEAAGAAADPQGPVEDPLAERRRGRHPGQDLRVHLLEHARHAADEVRRDLPQVLRKPLDALGERRGQAEADPEEALHPGEGVREREEEEMDVALAHPGGPRDHVERRQVVAVRLHDALRGAGGARGVDDRRDVGRLDAREARARARPVRCASRPSARSASQSSTRRRPRSPAAGAGSLDHDDGLEARHLRGDGERLPRAAARPRRTASASPSPARCRRASRAGRSG